MAPVMGLDSSPFRQIPIEVLLKITKWLTTPELCRFRLCARAIADMLDHSFVREFFGRKQFMFTEFSLRALVDISKSRLSPHLTRLQFGTERVSDHFGFFDGLTGAQMDAYKEVYADEFCFLNSGLVYEYLTEAFRNLANLEDVVIRDFNSPRRERDGPGTPWRSYGAVKIHNETGYFPEPFRDDEKMNRMFVTILSTMARAGARPRGIETLSHGRHPCLNDYAFHIPKYLETSLEPLLDNLKKLHIAVNNPATEPAGQLTGHLSHLVMFLRRTRSLQDLRINGNGKSRGHPSPPGESMDMPTRLLLAIMADPELKFDALETLSLGFMSLSEHVLLAFLRVAQHLKSLSLWRMTLHRSRPSQADVGPFEPKQTFWPDMFRKIRELPLDDLHHIQIGHMMQKWAPRDGYTNSHDAWALQAIELPFVTVCPAVVQYKGIDWRHFLMEQEKLLQYDWPPSYDRPNGRQSSHYGSGEDSDSTDDTDRDDDEEHDEDEMDE